MKTKTLLLLFVVIVAFVSCGGGDSAEPQETGSESAGQSKESAAEASEKPDADDDDADAEPKEIDLSTDVQRRLGVAVKPAAIAELSVPLQVTGSVQAINTRITHVRPFARGRVQNVLVRVGDRVARSQPLAQFDNIEAGELAAESQSAQAELARLRVQLATATRQAERARRLAEIGAVPQRESEASLGEQRQLEASVRAQESRAAGIDARRRRFGATDDTQSSITVIRAPFAGVVIAADAAPGDVVDASADLFAIADLTRVNVHAQVFEKDLGKLRRDQPAVITVEAYPDQPFEGRVIAIGDVVDPKTRTVAVLCEVANPGGLLKLGMFAKVALPTAASKPGLAVASSAIQTLEGRRVVFVKSGDSEFVVRDVETGRVGPGVTEVRRGVKAGEMVVSEGAFQVKSALLAGELGEEEEEGEKR